MSGGSQSSARGVPSPTSALIAGGLASMVAECCTIPFDVTKVRLQLLNRAATPASALPPMGMTGTMSLIIANEGAVGLFKGLKPALVRQAVYTSTTMALYQPLRQAFVKDSQATGLGTFAQKLACGGLAGGIGIAVANPTEVVKVLLQSDRSGKLFKGPWDAAQQIHRGRGLAGFFRGLVPNVQRGIIVNAAELGVYDHCKELIAASKLLPAGVWTHFGASLMAGFAGAVASNPVDVVKTRLMAQAAFGPALAPASAATPAAFGSVATVAYTGALDCARRILREEGFAALYQGFLPNWLRKGPWCVVFFLSYEKLLEKLS